MPKTEEKKPKPKTVKKEIAKIAVKPVVKAAVVKKVTTRVTSKKVEKVKAVVKESSVRVKGIIADVLGMDGKKSSTVTLPGEIFQAKINPKLMAQAVRVYLANQRNGTASTKTRGEVSGTTKKIYRQKGTGRARHGAAKAPIFVGGGITFGPRPHSFSLSLPKKMKKGALFSALSSKLLEKKLLVVDFNSASGKTKETANALKNLGITQKNGSVRKILMVSNKDQNMINRSAKNIEGVEVLAAQNLNTYEVLQGNTIILTKETVDTLRNTFLKGN